ncbi:MAG: bifunctional phosphopantothenoylcysteine decarboxylase/phosphopantothenate--cysteine ligase CoaBC [Rickettsiales bacterium]
MTSQSRILLIISGSIAAYKSLELIRLLRKRNITVSAILTKGGSEFITPLAVSSLTGQQTYTDLFSLKDEVEMGHIRLTREADLVVVAPASAELITKMAQGHADDLASATLLASNKPILLVPAMNHAMWSNPATKRNVALLKKDGVQFIDPVEGEMACGEYGIGRMAEVEDIAEAIRAAFTVKKTGPLAGKKAIVTAGPTYEAIDPVRFIGNRSSGKQGYAIAASLAKAGADVALISGPSSLTPPADVTRISVTTAEEMLRATMHALPADIAVFSAAVSDWRVKKPSAQKLKKRTSKAAPSLTLEETPDVLATIAAHTNRPTLVVGFAAETEQLLAYAEEKRRRKKADWILANDVSEGKIFGEAETELFFISTGKPENWGTLSKEKAAAKLVEKIELFFEGKKLKRIK